MKNYSGKIIVLAFPDTFVKYSTEAILRLFPFLGLGKKKYIKAGHAAFVLIQNQTGKASYFDFGRYITPLGYGRVRSAVTDAELEIPFKAVIKNNQIDNLDQLLIWLEGHPQKTHGQGRLIASVCDYIDYKKAHDFVITMQEQGSIPYKAFGKSGSNCSRIVTDTILAGTDHPVIRKALLRNKKFTPSTVGNVEKSAIHNPIYEVYQGKISVYKGTAFKENITNYFDKKIPSLIKNTPQSTQVKNAQFLEGIGSSAYFDFGITQGDHHEIIRYDEFGYEDFRGYFEDKARSFNPSLPYQFVYDSNCKYCHVLQNQKKIRFDLVQKKVL